MHSKLRYGVLAGLAVLVGHPALAQSQSGRGSIIDDPEIRQLQDQDIDANEVLMEALRRASRQGAEFRLSPENVSINTETGESRRITVRLTNAGDLPGDIGAFQLVGQFEGLGLDTTCPGTLPDGDFCEITISYDAGDAPTQIQTAVSGQVQERGRTRDLTIPISVRVQLPPPPPPPEPEPEPTVVAPPPAPSGPQPRDIVRGYFGMFGPGLGADTRRGFTIVSAPEDPRQGASIAGVDYADIRVETITEDERYDPETVPFTEASLPVDRDRILTADRVIKAVLETPVSNVMCGQVVAMVESDVYSATSSRPLIQAGSRVIGQCQQFVDERVGIAWSRIITTDGRSVTFRNFEADTRDATGLGGAVGRIYMSPFDRYVLPIFSTMIDTAAGVIYATFGENESVRTDDNGNLVQDRSATNEGLRIVTEEARGTAQQIISDIRDVREIAVIPKGSRIDIQIIEDIYFSEGREVVRVADLRFDLEGVPTGSATRDLPESLVLTPAEPGYNGPVIAVDGRSYRVTSRGAGLPGAGATDGESSAPTPADATLEDLRGGGQAAGQGE